MHRTEKSHEEGYKVGGTEGGIKRVHVKINVRALWPSAILGGYKKADEKLQVKNQRPSNGMGAGKRVILSGYCPTRTNTKALWLERNPPVVGS